MNRRNIIIISVIVGLLIIGGVVFFLLSRPSGTTTGETPLTSLFGRLPLIGGRVGPTPPSGNEATTQDETLPPSTTETRRRIVQLTDEPVIGPAFDVKTQKIFYYKKRDGHLVSNTPSNGNEETVSNLTILNILEVFWSPDKKKTVIVYQDSADIKKFISEATSTPKVAFLPKESSSLVWSLDGKTIWWLQKQDQTYALISSDTNGKNQSRKNFTTPIPELKLSIISLDTIMLVPKTVSYFETPLLLFSLKTSALSPILTAFGLTALRDPNPKTQNILYTNTSRGGALDNIHLLDLKTGKDTFWPLKTLASKCAFSPDSKLVFCAVPKNPLLRDLPEAWFEGKTTFSDSIYKLDLTTSKAEEIFNEGDYDATSLVISDDYKNLFFIDKKTGFLYGLSTE
ncbi:MAG: hypothetical protein Q7R91_01640 [bacterium]|nr:hypothetical protein [bacterium]